MNERIMQFRVGVMILATLLIAAILVLLFNKGSTSWLGTYKIYIKFKEAPGVARDTPVLKAGIRIGRVSNVQFAEDDTGVIVTAEIDNNRQLYHDEQCRATRSLLMGDAALEFVRNPAFQGKNTPIQPGESLLGAMAPDMTGSLAGMQKQAAQTMETLNTAGRDVDRLANRVDRLVETNEQRITHMIGQADETMQLLQKALIASNDLLGDPQLRAQIKQTIAEMPVVLEEMQGALKGISGTFNSLDRAMQEVEGLTKPLGQHGAGMVDDLDASLKNLNQLSGNLLRFSRELNEPQGSLGALLHDKELYQHVNRVAKNFDELSRELKPILNNVAIFTDKIARHPSSLGVRGALEKDSGLKESPSNDGCETDAPQPGRWPIGGSGRWSLGQ